MLFLIEPFIQIILFYVAVYRNIKIIRLHSILTRKRERPPIRVTTSQRPEILTRPGILIECMSVWKAGNSPRFFLVYERKAFLFDC